MAGLHVSQIDVDDISESSFVGQHDMYGSCGLTKIRMKGIEAEKISVTILAEQEIYFFGVMQVF